MRYTVTGYERPVSKKTWAGGAEESQCQPAGRDSDSVTSAACAASLNDQRFKISQSNVKTLRLRRAGEFVAPGAVNFSVLWSWERYASGMAQF
jgi:hypothetical protein